MMTTDTKIEVYWLVSEWTLEGCHALVKGEKRGETESQSCEFITPEEAERLRDSANRPIRQTGE